MKIPRLYKRGAVIMFSGCSFQTISEICNLHSLEVESEYCDGFIIKTEVGKEISIAQYLMGIYPNIFNSYERIDVMWENATNTIYDVIDLTTSIEHEYARKDGDVKKLNELIDDSIKKLNSLRI